LAVRRSRLVSLENPPVQQHHEVYLYMLSIAPRSNDATALMSTAGTVAGVVIGLDRAHVMSWDGIPPVTGLKQLPQAK
jgi:hypothetical protein